MDEEYDDVINDEYEETIESIQGENTRTKKGHVIFEKVNHSDRAAKFKVLSDGEVAKYVNVALEYFNNRCALSGERFEKFKSKIDRKIGTNLSAEHVVALCQGGHDIVPNLVPSVLQYNISKNGYYLLDWWEKQKDINGKTIYSPYRLLKLVNFMIKSIEAREFSQGKEIKNYRKAIMTPNEIDEFLEQIEVEDELEIDNSKKKIFSETITATTLDENNKKILTQIPTIEGNMPSHSTQVKEREQIDERVMMDIFLTDAVKVLEQQLPNEVELHSKLNEKLANVVGEIPFEVNVRNIILQKLEKLGLKENKYSVANDLLSNMNLIELTVERNLRENEIENKINEYLKNSIEQLKKTLDDEQLRTAIAHRPNLIYNDNSIKKVEFWKKNRYHEFDRLLQSDDATDKFIDIIIVLKQHRVDLKDLKRSATINDIIKNKNEEEQLKILEELKQVSEEIYSKERQWKIGNRLTVQKNDKNVKKFKEKLEKLEIELTEEEMRHLTEVKEQDKAVTTEEYVQILIVLKKYGIDLTELRQDATINDMIKNRAEEEQQQILEELKEISEDIYDKGKEWGIGHRLNSQKSRNLKSFEEELDKSGIELTEEEMRHLTEVKEQGKVVTTEEYVQILIVLKKHGIDLTELRQDATINDMIKNRAEEEQQQILEELKEISEDIYDKGKEWGIGHRLNYQKSRNLKSFEEELEKSGIELTEEEMRYLTKVKEQGKAVTTEEYVQILIILKEHGIDLTELRQDATINDMIKNRTEEEQQQILEELKEISEDIYDKGKEWGIGHRLAKQKNRNLQKFKDELKKSGIELNEEEFLILTQKINKQKESKMKLNEIMQVLIILKQYGVDLTKIKQKSDIGNLLEDNNQKEIILNELKKQLKNINIKWPIGMRLSYQKNNNIEQFKTELYKYEKFINNYEIEYLIEKENNQQKSERLTEEFVQVLFVLKNHRVDLTGLQKKSKIIDMIKDKDKEEQKQILEELKQISEEINDKEEEWTIGNRLTVQKNRNIEQFKEKLEKSGIQLTSEELKHLTETKKQSKQITTDEFVQILVTLKQYEIDLINLKRNATIKDIIKDKDEEEQKQILKELKEITESINIEGEKWQIGKRLERQKSSNLKKFKDGLKKSGIKLTEKEEQYLTKIETNQEKSVRITQEFVQVLLVLKCHGVDLTELQAKSKISDIIKNKDEKEQKQILDELKEVSESIEIDGEKWPIGVRLSTQKNANIEQFKEELVKTQERLNLTEQEIHKMLDKGKDISRSEEMIQFIRRTVKEQKDNGTLGENYEVEKEFEETIRQAEQNIDKEDGER